MKFAFSPGLTGLPAYLRIYGDLGVEAEKLGYDAMFLPDHLSFEVTPTMPGNETKDTWVAFAYVAGKTETLRFGTYATPVPRYIPTYLAKIITTLDILSNGRASVTFGAGWNPTEFREYAPGGVWDGGVDHPFHPKPHPDDRIRVAKQLEATQLIFRLWTEDNPLTFKGKYYSVKNMTFFPKPVQKPHPPVWQGGRGEYQLKLAARYYDGYLGAPAEYEAQVQKIKEEAKRCHRDMSKFTWACWGGNMVDIDKCVKQIEALKAAGCQYILYTTRRSSVSLPPPNQLIEVLREFGKEAIPSFK